MSFVVFSNMVIDEFSICLDVISEENVEPLKFEFNIPHSITYDVLAHSLAALVGRSFSSIAFEFPVSSVALEAIASWTGAETVAAEKTDVDEWAPDNSTVLNFSGGFDSLSAKLLLPSDTTLVSLDFGGRFAREQKFFSEFNPLTVKTNLVDTGLRRFSWAFMGVGPLLLRNVLGAKYFSFGSIMEATGFRRQEPPKSNFTFPPFKALGFENAAPVQGVSEIGTAQILLKDSPELVSDSLRSLANPGEEKYFRKIAITQVVAEMLGIQVSTPRLNMKQRVHYAFGENFAVDITALYFANLGREDLALRLVHEIPADVLSEVKRIDMGFMLKANPDYYSAYPQKLRPALEKGLASSGIDWYSPEDFNELGSIRSALSEFYQF